jgi:hypothetical protein
MQIALFRDDEHMVGLNVQSVRDQFNRHLGEGWENFMEPGVRIKATGRSAYANDGEVL